MKQCRVLSPRDFTERGGGGGGGGKSWMRPISPWHWPSPPRAIVFARNQREIINNPIERPRQGYRRRRRRRPRRRRRRRPRRRPRRRFNIKSRVNEETWAALYRETVNNLLFLSLSLFLSFDKFIAFIHSRRGMKICKFLSIDIFEKFVEKYFRRKIWIRFC